MLSNLRNAARNRLARRWEVPSIEFALERLKKHGVSPRHVFDVGAYRGEFAELCRRLWPDAAVTCFEVLPDPCRRLSELARGHQQFQLIPCLLGATNQSGVELHLAETASSVLTEQAKRQTTKATFQMRTCDDIVQKEFGGSGPDFLKLDVQGYELEVLKGAVTTMQSLDVILAEVNLLDIHREVPLLAETVSWLASRNWVAYDICSLIRRPLDRALWQADMLFVPAKSPLRADKRYA